jgi:hypothetical protein
MPAFSLAALTVLKLHACERAHAFSQSLSYDDQCGVCIAGVQSSEEARRRTSEWLRKSVL